jgi:hypothetical protein
MEAMPMAIPATRRAAQNCSRLFGNRGGQRREREQHGGSEQQPSPAQPVAQRTRHADTGHTSQQQTAGCDLGLKFCPAELPLQEYDRAIDDRGVEPEKQAADGGH